MTKKRQSGRRLTLRWALLGFAVLALAAFAITTSLADRSTGTANTDTGVEETVATALADRGADTASTGAGSEETGEVRIYQGRHTVRHALAEVPSAAAPRQDGRHTLVWLSATWCELCHQMEPFAEPSAAKFADRVAFMEKSADHAPDLVRQFRVFGTPTFVLLDAQGAEVTRFGFQPTAEAFEAQLARALGD